MKIYKIKCYIEHTVMIEAESETEALEKLDIVGVEENIQIYGSDEYRFEVVGLL